MTNVIAAPAPTVEELSEIGIDRIIESAGRLGKGLDPAGRQQIYNAAEAVIKESSLTEDSYQRAVRALAEALNI
jgi:hypothetical protein